VCSYRCVSPRENHAQGELPSLPEPPSLPVDIWDSILQYGIGRLLFVMKTASQLAKLKIRSTEPSSSLRFAIDVLDLTSSMV